VTPLNPTLRSLLWPVPDLDAAIAFYRDAFGYRLKFRDGDRYAALDTGGLTLALVAGDEDTTGGVPAPSFRVDDISAAIETVTAAGGRLLAGPSAGPHETRATVRDPVGQVLVLYQRS
jgi:predicted enzyme related to lactoylglutathione lyase